MGIEECPVLKCGDLKAMGNQGNLSEAPVCDNLPEGTLEVVGWPSKPQALVGPLEGGPSTPALIFRSDSNAEDLQGCEQTLYGHLLHGHILYGHMLHGHMLH